MKQYESDISTCLFCEKKIDKQEELIVINKVEQEIVPYSSSANDSEYRTMWQKMSSVFYHKECFICVAGSDITNILDSKTIKNLKFSEKDFEKMTKLAGL